MKKSALRLAVPTAVMTSLVALTGCMAEDSSAGGGDAEVLADDIHSNMSCDEIRTTEELLAETAPEADEDYKIAVLLAGLNGYYYQGMAYGAEKAADESGVEVTISAGDGYTSPEVQLNQAQTAIQQGADAIVLAPVDPRGSLPVLDVAKDAGIPVVITSTELASDAFDSMVIQDDYAIGQSGADQLAELHPEGGQGVLIAGPANATWSLKRAAGFRDRIEEKYPELEIVAAPEQLVDPAKGLEDFNAASQAHRDIEWVYSVFFYQLLPDSLPQRYDGIPFVTTGYEPAAIESLENGSLSLTAQLGNVWFGYQPVVNAVRLLNGDSAVPHVECMPFDAYTKDDIGSESADAELYPEGYVAK